MSFMEVGSKPRQIQYHAKTDLLYLRLDDRQQPVVNRRVTEDIVLDSGEDEKIVGIEIQGLLSMCI